MPIRSRSTALSGLVNLVVQSDTKRELFETFATFCETFGAELISYHRTARNLRRISELWDGFEFSTFPDDWVRHYDAQNYFEIDPIIQVSSQVTQPFRWFEVGQLTRLGPRQVAFLDDVRAHGITDGLGVPVYSALGVTGYFGVGTMKGLLRVNEAEILQIALACQTIHNRAIELDSFDDAAVGEPLTLRETEVLTLVARGQTNIEIAGKLGISDRTVDSLLRRVFEKLDVTDRVSASVKAIGQGLIRI
jgi:DNA-binding CsgD family transcriptional regulator